MRALYSDAENGFTPKHVGRMSKGRWRLLRTRAPNTPRVWFLGAAQAVQRSLEPATRVRSESDLEGPRGCGCKSQSPQARGPGAPIFESRRGWTSRLQERGGAWRFLHRLVLFGPPLDRTVPAHDGGGGPSLLHRLNQMLSSSRNAVTGVPQPGQVDTELTLTSPPLSA